MAITVNGVKLSNEQARVIIRAAIEMVEDGLDSDPGIQGELAGDLLDAGLVSQETHDDFVGA